MILNKSDTLKKIKDIEKYDVFYFYSTEEYLLQNIAQKTIADLNKISEHDLTQIYGPLIDIEQIIAAAGTISFFGTKRIVYISDIVISSISDDDLNALCDIMKSLENAVLIITCLFSDDKAKLTKKAKLLLQNADESGICADLIKPGLHEAKQFVIEKANSNNTNITNSEASLLVERIGNDFFALSNEVDKLCAVCNYKQITKDAILNVSIKNIDADVFAMVRFITSNKLSQALLILRNLIDLQNEPIAITAALSSAFIDMYRMKCAVEYKKTIANVMKDYNYKGSDYRLKKANENARNFTKKQLEQALIILCSLDVNLKSLPVNSVVLLQSSICEIANLGKC